MRPKSFLKHSVAVVEPVDMTYPQAARSRWPPPAQAGRRFWAGYPQVPQQRRLASASRSGLQSRHLHVNIGFAEGGGTLVVHHATGEAGQHRSHGRQPSPLSYFPISRSCPAKKLVPEIFSLIDDLRRKPVPAYAEEIASKGENEGRGTSESR